MFLAQTRHLASVSVMFFGSCHLILFVSSTNYFQIVSRQCSFSLLFSLENNFWKEVHSFTLSLYGVETPSTGLAWGKVNTETQTLRAKRALLTPKMMPFANQNMYLSVLPMDHLVNARILNWYRSKGLWNNEMLSTEFVIAYNFKRANLGNFTKPLRPDVPKASTPLLVTCCTLFPWDSSGNIIKIRLQCILQIRTICRRSFSTEPVWSFDWACFSYCLLSWMISLQSNLQILVLVQPNVKTK